LTSARRFGVIDDLRLTALFRARYRSSNAICAATMWRYAKSGPIDQTMEKFGS
jgi:hypothetical protein